jgi:hypothetical protein
MTIRSLERSGVTESRIFSPTGSFTYKFWERGLLAYSRQMNFAIGES